MVWDNRGLVSKIDKWGDAILRTYDDHLVKDLSGMLKRHPKLFFKFLAPGTKRYRGDKEEIFNNIKRLGLEDLYGLHDNGIEIKDQDLYRKGLPLQDLYRSDLIDGPGIGDFNRFQALESSSQYLKEVHNNHGGIGEALVGDIIFKKHEAGMVSEPKLNLPDIVFNEEKNISEKEKKATDILDFISSVGAEEFRVSDADSKAVNITQDSFTTTQRTMFTKHNEARVVNNKSLETILKDIGLKVCEEVLEK